jgi:hypothetical protein
VHTLLLRIGLSGHGLGKKTDQFAPFHQPSAGKDFLKRSRSFTSVKVHRTEHLVQRRQLAVSEIGSTTCTVVAAFPRWERKTATAIEAVSESTDSLRRRQEESRQFVLSVLPR